MAKSIKKNFIYNIILNLSKVIFPLITAPYISRVLEPDGVGLFNFSSTYASYFALFAALGVPMYGIREIAKIRDNRQSENKFLSEIISLELITTFLCTIIFVLSVYLIPSLECNKLLFLVAGIALYITPLKVEWFFSGHEDFGYITLRSLLIKTLSVIALFVFIHRKEDLLTYVIIGTMAIVANEIWNYIKLLHMGYRPYLTFRVQQHLKPLMILFVSAIAVSIYTMLDTLMLGFISSYDEVGFYNSANHIAKCMMPIVTSLAAVAMPRLSYYMQKGDWGEINIMLSKSLSVVSFLSFPMVMITILLAPTFVPLFFGELYIGSILPLQIIVLVVVVIGFNNITTIQILASLGYDRPYLYSVLSGTFTNFLLNLFLIPVFGAIGASIASVMAEVVILIVSIAAVIKHTKVRIRGIKETAISFVLGMLFIPLYLMISSYIKGWWLIIDFSLCALIFYFSFQIIFRNKIILSSFKLLAR